MEKKKKENKEKGPKPIEKEEAKVEVEELHLTTESADEEPSAEDIASPPSRGETYFYGARLV